MKYLIILLIIGISPAFASCESIHECTYSNLERDTTEVLVPSKIIPILEKQLTNIPITGKIADISKIHVNITVTSPDGSESLHRVKTTESGVFSTHHSILGDRYADGRYDVSVVWESDDEEYSLRPVSFHTKFSKPSEISATFVIKPNAEIIECSYTNTCFDVTEHDINVGDVIEWYNEGVTVHKIRSIAIGYDSNDLTPVNDDYIQSENYFETDTIKPGDSDTVRIPRAGSILFSCLFHPWMEGHISIKDIDIELPKPVKSIIDIIEPEIILPKIIVELDKQQASIGGEIISGTFAITSDVNGRVTVGVYDPTGKRIEYQVVSSKDSKGEFDIITQPTWTAGIYIIKADMHGKKFQGEAIMDIVEDVTLRCQSVNITKAKASDICYAGYVGEIKSGDKLYIGNKKIRLTISNPDTVDISDIQEICPIGSVALVDLDSTIQLDSRVSKDYHVKRQNFAKVTCGDVILNQQLIDLKLSKPDPIGCLTSEFAHWPQCDLVEIIKDDIVKDTTIPEDIPPPSKDCVIALAVYGTSLSHQVQILREYRDILLDSGWQSTFDVIHGIYYSISPSIADIQKESPKFNSLVRETISVPVRLAVLLVGIL